MLWHEKDFGMYLVAPVFFSEIQVCGGCVDVVQVQDWVCACEGNTRRGQGLGRANGLDA